MKPGSSFSVIFEADIFTIWLFSFGLHFSVYIFSVSKFYRTQSIDLFSCNFFLSIQSLEGYHQFKDLLNTQFCLTAYI